ncbi:MAG: [protein-PII] uridylyltransferase [Planctomycetota bacterium]
MRALLAADPWPVAELKAAFQQAKSAHWDQPPSVLRAGRESTQAWAETLDELLKGIGVAAARQAGVAASQWALLALGGYGRKELNPESDVDVLILHQEDVADNDLEALAGAIVRTLWDVGLKVGHAVRTVPGCAERMDDLPAATALLESRPLLGSRELVSRLRKEVLQPYWRDRGQAFIESKIRELRKRHAFYGGSVGLKEPNVKESAGGLRDYHVAVWIARALHPDRAPGDFGYLKDVRKVTSHDIAAARQAYGFLLGVRSVLHRLAGGKQDTLDMHTQWDVARFLEYRDEEGGLLGVERFMRDYYKDARTIHRLLKIVVDHFEERDARIEEGFLRIQDHLYLTNENIFRGKDAHRRMLRAFELCQEHGLVPDESVIQAVSAALENVRIRASEDDEIWRMFRDWLSVQGRVGVHLKEMHRSGLLGELLPEFGELDCLVRYDPYHRYTVDEHSLRCVEIVDEILLGMTGPSYAREIAARVERRDLLRLGALLHDVGKSKGPNHSERGATMMPPLCERMRMRAWDGETLTFLVRDHLQMSRLSRMRDFSEEEVLGPFAGRVGSLDRLDLLYLLTVADHLATAPNVLSNWKATLLENLHRATAAHLGEESAGQRHDPRSILEGLESPLRELAEAHLDLVPRRYLFEVSPKEMLTHVRLVAGLEKRDFSLAMTEDPDGRSIWVVAHDRPALLATIAGVLFRHRIDIQTAEVYTRDDGLALDRFRVVLPDDKPDAVEAVRRAVEADLARALSGDLSLEDLAGSSSGVRFDADEPLPGESPPKVRIDNLVSRRYTIIDMTTQDRLGLLFAIARVLAEQHLSVSFARLYTRAKIVTDVFYVSRNGEKIVDEKDVATIVKQLTASAE